MTDPSSRQEGHPTTNKTATVFTTKHYGGLPISCKGTMTLNY